MLEAEIMPPEPRGRPPAGPQTLAEVAQEQKNKLAKPYNHTKVFGMCQQEGVVGSGSF